MSMVCLYSFTKCFIVNVEHSGLMIYLRVVLYCNCVSNRSPCSIMSLLNIETLAVFRCTCLNFLCFTGRPVLSEELSSSFTDLFRTERFSFIFMSSGRPDLSRIGVGVGWACGKNCACRATSPSVCRTVSPSGC